MALEQITFNIGAFNDSDAGGNNYFTNTVFEVKNQSDNTFATIYADSSGTTQIPQNGIDNVSNSRGECNFYIDDGDFYIEVDSQKKNFKTRIKASGVILDGGGSVQNLADSLNFETVDEAVNYSGIPELLGRRVCIKELKTNFLVQSSSGMTENLTSIFISTTDPSIAITRIVENETIDVSQGLVNDSNISDNDLRVEELLAYGVEVTHEDVIKVVQPIRILSNYVFVTKTGRGRVHNVSTSTPPRFIGQGTYYSNCLSVGNYGGETSDTYGALWVLNYSAFNNASEGETDIEINDGSINNFSSGDIVIIKSTSTFTEIVNGKSIPKYCQVNKIKSISGNLISLEEALNFEFNNNSLVAVADDSFTGLDGYPSYIADNVTIRTGLKTDKLDNWSAAHFSGYNCNIDILDVDADNRGVGCNPLAYSEVKLRSNNPLRAGVAGTSPASGLMLEIAHLCNNVDVDGQWPVGTFNCSECGSDINGTVSVGDGHMGTARKHRVKVRFSNKKWSETTNVLPTVILAKECEGSQLLDGSRVVAGLSNAVVIGEGSIDHKIIGCTTIGGGSQSIDSNKAAVNIESGAINPIVSSNNIGASSKTYSDRIASNSATATITGNNSILSLPKVYDKTSASTGGATGLVVLKAYNIDPNRFTEGSLISFLIRANILGTSDFKALRLKLKYGTTETEMLSIPFSAEQNGRCSIDITLGSIVYSASGANSVVRVDGLKFHPQDGVETVAATFNCDRSETLQLIVYGEAINSDDTIQVQSFIAEPKRDQFSIT